MTAASPRIIGMARRGYNGPSLHPNAKDNSARAAASTSISPRSSSPAPAREKSVETDAEPLSSSEEEESKNKRKSLVDQTPRPSETASDLAPVHSSARSRSSKRKAIGRPAIRDTDPPARQTSTQASASFEDNSFDAFALPQSKMKKRKPNKYGKSSNAMSTNQQKSFNHVPALLEAVEADQATTSYNIPKEVPERLDSLGRIKPVSLNVMEDPGQLAAQKVPEMKFFVPLVPDEPASSSTTGTDLSLVFDHSELPLELGTRGRSGSTSSLSSADSGASLVLTKEQKRALREDDELDGKVTARCPLCDSKVDRLHLEEFNSGRRMNIRTQQRFCEDHKEREAKTVSERQGYPDIDWKDLERRRIPEYIPHLEKVLQRDVGSYYRTMLEGIASQSDRKKLRRYLGQEIVDVVKYGYYGPKGARVIGNKISSQMSKALSKALKEDKFVKATEVGGYVSAVLVPEVLVKLVMEDMKIGNEDDARRILAESTELGLALHGDDDERILDSTNNGV